MAEPATVTTTAETSRTEPGAWANDYAWQPGMKLRPIPPGKDQFGDLWMHFRRNLFGEWIDVEAEAAPTDQTRMFDDHMWQGDEFMDPVADMFQRLGHKTGRQLFERALADGIDSIADAPPELVRLFKKYEKAPDWYDPARGAIGQSKMKAASMVGAIGVMGFATFDTLMNTDVSASTGATGRFRTEPVRRFAESGKYISLILSSQAVSAEPAGTEVFRVAMRVRLMHALARTGLKRRWGEEHYERHGNPISNSATCGFMEAFLLFQLMDHVFGRKCTEKDLDDAWHFASYWLYIVGVAEELIPRNALDAIRNLDYLVARDGGPSEWRQEMVEVLVGEQSVYTGMAQKMTVWILASTGNVTFGPVLTTELFAGTSLSEYDHERAGRQLRRASKMTVRLSMLLDRLPGRGALQKRGWGAFDILLWVTFGVIERMAAKQGIDTDFQGHDQSGRGNHFGAPRVT